MLTPVMAATVLTLSLAWERLWEVLPNSPYFEDAYRSLETAGIIAVGAFIAFAMVWAEYMVRDWASRWALVAVHGAWQYMVRAAGCQYMATVVHGASMPAVRVSEQR